MGNPKELQHIRAFNYKNWQPIWHNQIPIVLIVNEINRGKSQISPDSNKKTAAGDRQKNKSGQYTAVAPSKSAYESPAKH